MLLGCAAWGFQITDQRGVVSTFDKPPARVVSLLPSLTESVCALGQCQRLVGVDRYSNFPDTVQSLPKLGGGLDPNIEAVVALKPDVVLMAVSSRASARLESLGVKVVALEPKNQATVRQVLNQLGVLFDLAPAQGADSLWRAIDTGVSAAAQSLTPKAHAATVYFEVNRGPYAASESSFIGETLTRLGLKNVVPGSLGPFPRLNAEFVVRANPDVMMIGNQNLREAMAYPGWGHLRAVQDGKVCTFDAKESDVLVRAGPRMAEAARLMVQCINRKFAHADS